MDIALAEPYFSGSHKRWSLELATRSSHHFQLFTLPGRYWKWRMHGGAISLAEKWNQHYNSRPVPPVFIGSDMLDLCTFKALIKKPPVSFHLYFHENQITYPWSSAPADTNVQRDNHYGFINFSSALCADRVWFNSNFHKNAFLDALPAFLNQYPDRKLKNRIGEIEEKAGVLPLGLDLKSLRKPQPKEFPVDPEKGPIILWNHRWEYDKKPEKFFEKLFQLKAEGISFQVAVLGASFRKSPAVFEKALKFLKEEIIHVGYAHDLDTYRHWLWRSHILPVTSIQDFFGGSVVEAIYCQCLPLLPDRLAYPEHIPSAHRQKLIYSETPTDELYQKLKFFVQNPADIPNITKECSKFVEKYDWDSMISIYDTLFSS